MPALPRPLTRSTVPRRRFILPFITAAAAAAGACSSTPQRPHTTHDPLPAPYESAVVVADHPTASEAGFMMLMLGGNAVDAAVATSFCLSVVRPESCGIGGGGFMVIHLADDPRTETPNDPVSIALDYRERAPAAITPYTFESLDPNASTDSGLAVAIPGTVAGLLYALEHFGTLDRETVLAPAIRAAEEGFTLDRSAARAATTLCARIAERTAHEDRAPTTGEQWLIDRFCRGSAGPRAGRTITLPEQARALRLIAEHGASAFYSGPIADAIIRAASDSGGVITHEDLASFTPRELQPLRGSFLGRSIITMPLPSSGGVTMLQILAILQSRPELFNFRSPTDRAYVPLLTEAMKHAFADRARWLGDPDFSDIPLDRLLDPTTIKSVARRIDPARTMPPEFYGIATPPPDDAGTSHFSIVDRWGNAVACTETINTEFGAAIAVHDFGFALNNQMDDFLTRRGEANTFNLTQSERNLPAPGKRPLSSMSPTIVLDDEGRVILVAGASGGPRIISATLQSILNVLLFDMSAEEAVATPRIHHQWSPDILYVEPGRYRWSPNARPFSNTFRDLRRAITSAGHRIAERQEIGHVQLIRRVRIPFDDRWDAAADPRKGGRPVGQ